MLNLFYKKIEIYRNICMLFYKINDLRYYYFEAEIKFNFCLYVIFLKVNIIF